MIYPEGHDVYDYISVCMASLMPLSLQSFLILRAESSYMSRMLVNVENNGYEVMAAT